MCARILESFEKNYDKALNEVGSLNNTVLKYRVESYRRHLAVNRTLQAFKNQFLRR